MRTRLERIFLFLVFSTFIVYWPFFFIRLQIQYEFKFKTDRDYVELTFYDFNLTQDVSIDYFDSILLPFVEVTTNESCEQVIDLSRPSDAVEMDERTYPARVPLHLNRSIKFECLNRSNQTKVILFWTPFWTADDYQYPIGHRAPFKQLNCPVHNCETTANRSRLDEADLVVVVDRPNVDDFTRLPPRPPKQRWLYANYESPVHLPASAKYDGLFNYTSTYSLDSDFPGFYESLFQFEWSRSESNSATDRMIDGFGNKNQMAAILVSNCDNRFKRLSLIDELRSHGVHVTVFGKCGTYQCGDDCRRQIALNFKFYLAFENSLCNDYVTEKLFDVLNYNIIPVVYGGADYERFLPRSAYINVFDFPTLSQLANYMLHLSQNRKAYNAYFKWKTYLRPKRKPVYSTFCDMCIHLNLENRSMASKGARQKT